MKKILSMVVAILVVATVMTVAVSAMTPMTAEPTDVTASEVVVKLDSTAGTAVKQGLELSTVKSGDSNILAAKITDAQSAQVFSATASLVNSSDYNYLQFWMDFSEITSDAEGKLVMWFRMYDENGACVDCYGMKKDADNNDNGGRFYYQENGEWVEKNMDKYGRMLPPSNYVGYIRIDLEDFKNAYDSYEIPGDFSREVEGSKALDITKVTKMEFRHNFQKGDDKTASQDKTFYFGDFKFVKCASLAPETEAPVETTTPAPVETTTAPVETTTPAPVETTTPAPVETTTPAPEETTTAAPETEAPKDEGGCGGSVALLSVAAILAGAACVVARKKD